jgi:hypothetical protein
MLHPSRTLVSWLLAGLLLTAIACNKKADTESSNAPVPSEILQKIYDMGFSTAGVKQVPGGYMVEGDIFLKTSDLDKKITTPVLRIAESEQYRTNNLVQSLPRTINIAITGLPADFTTALDNAIARYNALNLRLTFQRVTSGAHITVQHANIDALGSAGFPSGGNPYSSILLNSNAFGIFPDINFLTTVIAHELGHCIGFRHTDYFNRGFSGCLVDATHPANEGTGPNGAIHIFGTPSWGDAGSWMLACTDGSNRPFNFNDIIALRALYGSPSPSCGPEGYRLINGNCEQGVKRIVSGEYDEFHDRCQYTYYYYWSNGEIDYMYGAIEPGPCP